MWESTAGVLMLGFLITMNAKLSIMIPICKSHAMSLILTMTATKCKKLLVLLPEQVFGRKSGFFKSGYQPKALLL